MMERLSRIARKHRFAGMLIRKTSNIVVAAKSKLPQGAFAQLTYWQNGRKGILNLKNPKTFNEKLWWLKFHYRNPLQKICSDKYRVHEYLHQLGEECGELELPLVGVYKRVEDIDLSQFDKEVIFKLNVGSGANMIYNPQIGIDENHFRAFFMERLHHDYYQNSREWNFKDVPPVIIAEQVLRDAHGNLPIDYKFMCFSGKPVYVFCSEGAMDSEGRHSVDGVRFTNIYDMDWNLTEIVSSYPRRPDIQITPPKCFDRMKEIAAKLSEPFPHVRIDLYEIEGKIYLGEFTFFHSGGCGNIEPISAAESMGEMIRIDSIGKEHLI